MHALICRTLFGEVYRFMGDELMENKEDRVVLRMRALVCRLGLWRFVKF